MPRPRKIQWPISFDEMLRYAFKKKRPEDRLRFYRLFLRDFLRPHSTRQASSEEIENELQADLKKNFSEDRAHHIRLWSQGSFEAWKGENIKSRMRKMAAARWSSEARKKRQKSKNIS
jgi:hypothetical protein